MRAGDIKDIAIAIAIFGGIYIAYQIYKSFKKEDDYKIEEHFTDGVRLPDGRTINLARRLLDSQNVFLYQGVLYKLSGTTATRAPTGYKYYFSDGGLVIQNQTGNVTVVD